MAKHRLTWTGDGSLDLSQVLDDRGIPILFPKTGAAVIVRDNALKHPLVLRYLKPGAGMKSEVVGEGPAVPAAPAAAAPAPAAPPKPKPAPAPDPKPKEKAPEPEAKAKKEENTFSSTKASDSEPDVVTSAKDKKDDDKKKSKSRGK